LSRSWLDKQQGAEHRREQSQSKKGVHRFHKSPFWRRRISRMVYHFCLSTTQALVLP